MHDGYHGPLLLHDVPAERSRGRGLFHRLIVWFFSRPDRRPW